MEPENLALDRCILAQTGTASPKVTFLPTVSGDADGVGSPVECVSSVPDVREYRVTKSTNGAIELTLLED